MADLVLFGAGQIASVAKMYIDAHGPDRIVGFTVDADFVRAETFEGLPLVAWEHLERFFPPERVQLLGPLSYRRLNDLRRDRYLEGKRRGYTFASFVHPSSSVYAQRIGDNAFILENNTIQPYVTIGSCAMIWSGNHIGHHAVVGDYCFIGSQNGLSSNARVGDSSFIGGQCGLAEGVTIGTSCFIASRAVVLKDLPDESVVVGTGDRAKPFSSERVRRRL